MPTATLRELVVVLFLIMIGLNAYQTWRIAFVRHEADFPAYLAGAHGFLNGTNPYAPTAVPPYNTIENYRPFIYPLFIAWLWVPFALLPPILASLVWYLLSVAILVKVLRLLAKLLLLTDERHRLIFYGFLSILFVSVIQSDLMFGQMNIFVLLLLLLGVEHLEKTPMKSGLGFGAAISAKFMPLVLLPVVLLRSPRAFIVTMLSIVVFAVLIPFLIAGPKIIEYYQYWFNNTIFNEIGQRNEYGYTSFDVASVLAQLMGMSWPTTIMRAACGLILLVFPLILLKKGSHLHAFFLAFVLLPLTATRSEPDHLVILMPAVGLLLAFMLKNNAKAWTWCGLVALQLTILWGYNKAIPFDTFGMLVLFAIIFSMWIRKDSIVTAGRAELGK